LTFASAAIVHLTMPPHEPGGYTSTTEPFAIGISYTGHRKAMIEVDGVPSERSFAPGNCAINGSRPIQWLRVCEPSEAVEIYPSAGELRDLSDELRVDWTARSAFVQLEADLVIWSTCTRYRMTALGATALAEPESDALVHNLLVHVATCYLGARTPKRISGRLDARRLARVTAFIEASLPNAPSLRAMADAAAMSPFHFQRLFRATTGFTPAAYVMARRMERASRMLNDVTTTVAQVAAETGFSDLAHFRRAFRRQFNRAPRGT
jgi:AraC family transcriptional regulator